MGFDNDVAQAQHDYRYGKAQADHDLAIGDAADYAGEIAAAQIAEQSGYDLAYENFATLAMPAISEQGIDDAAAEFLDRKTIDDADLYDIVHNNQAVDGYQDEESILYAGEQSADATALSHEQISDAIGHAGAIAGATLACAKSACRAVGR